ncbi:hypothetical protein RN001_011105 [Aquatica leii]|uniref:Uncharacterized protein n=1 Tax=Aquatica leii TaxID=1421715 RepID=A0AAN7PVM3_9COLE|nr:hypothetical protein RN001_011105 [Aquatica leii]
MIEHQLCIIVAFVFVFAPISCQELYVNPPDDEVVIDASTLVKRNSILAGNANETMPEDGGVLSLLIQIFGGVLQGMLDSQGITSDHVNNALNIFSPEKVHDDLILFRKTLNLALRFVTFIMRFLPRPSVDGGFNPLEFFKSKIAFYNTKPVSENGPFIGFNKIEPVLRPDVPERIQKVVDFAIEDSEAEEGTATNTAGAVANLTDDDVRMLVPNSRKNSSGDNVPTTTVISITQYVSESSANAANAQVTKPNEAGGTTEKNIYPSPARNNVRGTTKPPPLIRQPITLSNEFNIRDAEDNDLGSDFGQIRRDGCGNQSSLQMQTRLKQHSKMRRRLLFLVLLLISALGVECQDENPPGSQGRANADKNRPISAHHHGGGRNHKHCNGGDGNSTEAPVE